MSNTMLQLIIKNLLFPYYGDSDQLQFLLKPQSKIYRLLIAKELVRKILAIAAARNEQDSFYKAVASDIDDELQNYSRDRVNSYRRYLRRHRPNPPHLPLFLDTLFSHYFPVDV